MLVCRGRGCGWLYVCAGPAAKLTCWACPSRDPTRDVRAHRRRDLHISSLPCAGSRVRPDGGRLRTPPSGWHIFFQYLERRSESNILSILREAGRSPACQQAASQPTPSTSLAIGAKNGGKMLEIVVRNFSQNRLTIARNRSNGALQDHELCIGLYV